MRPSSIRRRHEACDVGAFATTLPEFFVHIPPPLSRANHTALRRSASSRNDICRLLLAAELLRDGAFTPLHTVGCRRLRAISNGAGAGLEP